MKILVNGMDLSNAVMKVSKAISVRTTSPILEGIKLSVKGDNLTLSATDMEISIEKTIRSDTYQEGETVVPGKMFVEFIKKLEDVDQVELYLEEKNKLKISYSESEVYFSCYDADEFPTIKKDLKENYFSILQKDVKDLINKTVFSCATDESRPILKGALIEVEEDNEITFVALDGFRMAVERKKVKSASGHIRVIVPARGLMEIARLLEKDEEEVTIYFEENTLLIEIENTIITTRLLQGEFINYKQIIPVEYLTQIKINKNILLNSFERANVLAREARNNLIKIEIKDNYVYVKATSENGNINESVICNMNGKDIQIAFNARFFSDALKAITDEFINIYFNNSISPIVIKPFSGNEYLYLVLPIRLS